MYNPGSDFSKAVARISLLVLLFPLTLGAQATSLRHAAQLDSEQKCDEAERIYQQVLSAGPPSLALLNNVGNHYVVCGNAEKARSYFERIVKANPQHGNANLQLARIAADRRQGVKALEYLSHVTDSQPVTRLLRAEAAHWAGKQAAALAMLDAVQKETSGDLRLVFLYGLTCARIGAYDRAETAFNSVLAQRPDDFDVLFNLGRAAARAKHYDRAQRALEVAIKLQPESIDALVELGQLSAAQQNYTQAIFFLAQAKKLAPRRPDIVLTLAHAAQGGAYYGDAAIAYDEYLELNPADDSARRDRGLVSSYIDSRKAEGLKELTAYVQKHPNDPIGHYDLALLSWRDRPQEALGQLSQAVRLDARFAAAYVNRAWLLSRLGRAAEAIPDLLKAVEIDARDFRALDQLGLTYSSLDRPADAEKVLRRALSVAADDPDVLMHLGRALMELGREEEAQPFLAKFQSIRPQKVRGPRREAGMIESATLSTAERTSRQIERLRQDAKAHPDDPELQLHFASLLLTDGRIDEASAEFRVLLMKNAEPRVWEEAGKFLLLYEQYKLAQEFLSRTTASLDLAIALLYTEGPEKALDVLEKTPEKEQSGDYFLLKASILDAEKLLEQGLRLPISRPQIAQQAALLLVRHDRRDLALDLLGKAAGAHPDLQLIRAIVLALADRSVEAEKAMKQIESQWPEWDRAYLVHGMLVERTQPLEAARKVRTAIALGSQDPAARCVLTRLTSPGVSDPTCSCVGGLRELLFPTCAR